MKRKRGSGKRKPKLAALVGTKVASPNIVPLNTQDDLGLEEFGNAVVDSRMELETPQYGSCRTRRQANLQNQKVVDAAMEDSMSSFRETSVAVSANVSRIARSIMTKSSRDFASSIREPCSRTEQVQGGGMRQKEPNLSRQDRQYQDQELKAALEVIRKVMKMDASEPFNVPVDPVALGIPDYFDVIDTPMDFGTICGNIENCVKYKNAKDVLRDVQYIWDNCSKYNKKGHYVLELMKRVKKNFTKFWTEAGLCMEAQEIDEHSRLPATKSATRSNKEGHRSPLGSIAGFARHQHQDQADPSGVQPHQPSLSYCQSYQAQKRPGTYEPSSCQQQTSQPRAGTNVGSAGHSHLTPIEPVVRRSQHWHGCPVDPMYENSTHPQQKQTGLSQCQLQQHQPSLGYGQPYQPQQRFCQCQSCSRQPQPSHQQAGTYTAGAGDFNAMPPEESMIRYTKRGPRCPIGPMTDYISHQQQDQIAPSHMELNKPPSFYGQEHRPPQGTCRGTLSSSQHPSFGLRQHSQPHAEMDSEGDFYSAHHEESRIRSTKCGPSCPVGHMTDYVSHQQQDQLAPSHMQPNQPPSKYGQGHHPQQGTCRGTLSSSQLHPGFGPRQHFQPHTEIDGEGYSPPPVESMIRYTKSGPRCSAGPTTDNISHQQQDQVTPSQTHPRQPSLSDGQPHQPQEGASQGQLSSSQSEPSQPQVGVDMGSADSSSTRRRTRGGRGPTRCLKLWNTEGKIAIATNEFGQPIGLEAPKLVSFLGTIARDGHMAPLNYVDWRAIPDENKDKMWQQVQSKFEIEAKSKTWVLKSIGNKWRSWKAHIKSRHYNRHKTNEGRLANCDKRVLPDQWRILVSFWNSKESKKLSMINKACRARQKVNHASGSKSFARVREEQRAKRPDGKEPSRAELFIVTRTRKDGRPVDAASSAIISQLRERAAQGQGTPGDTTVQDAVFDEVVGRDRHGRVRLYGLGPSPSDLEGPKPSRTEALKMVSAANTEVREMKERMVTMEQTCAQMAAQMATMMSMMSTMQSKFPDMPPPNAADVSGNSEESRQPQGSKRSSSKNTRTGKAASRKRQCLDD